MRGTGDLTCTKYEYGSIDKVGDQDYRPSRGPSYVNIEGQLWQGVELGEPIGRDQRCISILARLETNLPMLTRGLQSQIIVKYLNIGYMHGRHEEF